jgi:hypothetical protein
MNARLWVWAWMGLAASIAWGLAAPAFGQIQWSNDRNYGQVRQWYGDYLGRDPQSDEARQWLDQMRRGENAADVQASLLGSDEYYERLGNDPRAYVEGLYRNVGSSQAADRDIDQWADRLRSLRNDRTALAREFIGNGGRLNTGYGTSSDRLLPIGGQDAKTVTRQIMTSSQLLIDSARSELAGTRQGRRVELRGDALMNAADDLYHAVTDQSEPLTIGRSLQFVRRALDEVNLELNNPPGSAPATSAMARRVASSVDALERQLNLGWAGPGGSGGSGGGPGSGGYNEDYDSRIVVRLVDSAVSSNRSLLGMADRQLQPGPATTSLVRDLDALGQRLSNLSAMARREDPVQRLQSEYRTAQVYAQRIAPVMQGLRSWSTAQTLWNNVNNALNALDQELRYSNSPGAGNPGIPDWGDQPQWPGNSGYDVAISNIDRAVAELDSYVGALTQIFFLAPDAARIQATARQLRSDLLTLRQAAARGVDRGTLTGYYRDADTRYRTMTGQANQILGRLGRNAPSLTRVDAAMRSVASSLQGAIGDAGSPVDATLLFRMADAMEQEISDTYFVLEAFNRYPEYARAADLLDSLSSSARQVAVLARRGELSRGQIQQEAQQVRQAASQLRDTANIISARANVPTERALQPRARDFQLRSDRVRKIAEDIVSAVR